MPTTRVEAEETLAQWHGGGSFPDIEIYAVGAADDADETVRLVEVSGAFGNTNRPAPVVMGRSVHMPFRTAVLLVTPHDWERIQRRALALPEGWDLHTARRVWPRD